MQQVVEDLERLLFLDLLEEVVVVVKKRRCWRQRWIAWTRLLESMNEAILLKSTGWMDWFFRKLKISSRCDPRFGASISSYFFHCKSATMIKYHILTNTNITQSKLHAQKHKSTTSESFMYLHLPIFDFPLVFNEKEYNYPDSINLRQVNSTLLRVFDPELDKSLSISGSGGGGMMTMETPVETKHRRLGRSHRTGLLDRELKPNARIRDELNNILRYPPTATLSDLEKDLIWKFRYYLTRDKKGMCFCFIDSSLYRLHVF